MLYFAYGSNMSSARLRARVPSTRRLGYAVLTGHRFVFQQQGEDSSAKCDACYTGQADDQVIGVLFQINPAEKVLLDGFEGLGRVYRDKDVTVEHDGSLLVAFTYCGMQPVADLRPYRWYKEHVLRGAVDAGLPEDYVKSIRAIEAMADPDQLREQRELSIYVQDES